MCKSVMVSDSKKCLACGTNHPQDKQHCPKCGRFLYTCGSIYQPKVVKNDIAPEFKQLLSDIHITALDEMQNIFTEEVNKKSHITAANQAILQSFNDERAKREEVCI